MNRKVHLVFAVTSTICIAVFFTATITVELFGSPGVIAIVKHSIVIPGLFVLIPAIAATGASGFALAKSRKSHWIERKKKRMPFIASNGLLVLVPAAIILDQWASAGLLDMRFYVVQGIELAAGAVNLTLMGLNIRDGLTTTGRVVSKSKVAIERSN